MLSIRSSRAADMDADVRNLEVHCVADVLSQKMPTCWCLKSGRVDSRISHPNTIPASSGSFIVRSPVGFD
eukprot:15104211-Ditylum_brightwellii.AAC.1